MKLRKIVLRFFQISAILLLVLFLVATGIWIYFHPNHKRISGIVYGKRNGKDLTIDVLQPRHPNGFGVVLMVSGEWRSSPG